MQAAHPALAQSKDLQNFLEASEEDWMIEVARANYESAGSTNAAKKTLSSTLQKLKDLGQQTQNLVSGKHTDEEEDPEYLKACSPFCLCSSNAMVSHCHCQTSPVPHQCLLHADELP